MKNYIALCAAVLLAVIPAFAEKSKVIDKHIAVAAGKKIILDGFSSATISFRTWDKPEAYVKLNVKVASSDSGKEQELLDGINVTDNSSGDAVTITMGKNTTTIQGTGYFNGNIYSNTTYLQRDIAGEIFLPEKNPVTADMRYGNYSFEGLQGELSIEGSSNTLSFKNCQKLREIESSYGKITILDCAGNLAIEAKSGKTKIENFKGAVKADVDYSTFELKNFEGDETKMLQIEAKSASLRLENIRQKMDIDAPYSKISLKNASGDLRVDGNACNLTVENFNGNISGDLSYSKVKFQDISATNVQIDARFSPIDIRLNNVPKSIKIDNEYGNVDVEIPAGFAGGVTLETSYGSVKSNLPQLAKSSRNQEEALKGSVGTGSGEITIRNKFASIKLQQM